MNNFPVHTGFTEANECDGKKNKKEKEYFLSVIYMY